MIEMNLQWSGLVLALLTFGTIAFGHVFVRRMNYHFGTKPVPYIALLGGLFLLLSLFVENDLLSAALGILGITTVWDAVEFLRQEERIRCGHAPANPNRSLKPRSSECEKRSHSHPHNSCQNPEED